jgi:hypothetical protein
VVATIAPAGGEQRQALQRRFDDHGLPRRVNRAGPEVAPALRAAWQVDLDCAGARRRDGRSQERGAEHQRVGVGEAGGIVLEENEGRRQHRDVRLMRRVHRAVEIGRQVKAKRQRLADRQQRLGDGEVVTLSGFQEFMRKRGCSTPAWVQRISNSGPGVGPAKPPMSWPMLYRPERLMPRPVRKFHFSESQPVVLSPLQVCA